LRETVNRYSLPGGESVDPAEIIRTAMSVLVNSMTVGAVPSVDRRRVFPRRHCHLEQSSRQPQPGDPDYDFAAFREDLFGGGLRWFATVLAVVSAAFAVGVFSRLIPPDLYWPIHATGRAAKAIVIGALVLWSATAAANWRAHLRRIMPLQFRPGRTATGTAELIATGECQWQEFPLLAQAVVDHFGMTVMKKTDGLDERVWITRIGESQFCVSWDSWFPEVSIMAWENTPDAEVERLAAGAVPAVVTAPR
jgi:hypothetical protein